MIRAVSSFWLVIVALSLAACGGFPPPKYPYTDASRALALHRLVRERRGRR